MTTATIPQPELTAEPDVEGPAALPHSSPLIPAAVRVSNELASSAVARERADALPSAEIDLLREAGLLRANASPEAGGHELTWPQLMRLVEIVAAGDTSIGQLLAYHYVNLYSAVLCATPEEGPALIERSAREGWFWGDAVNPRDPAITLTRDGDGFVANGRKTFTSGSAAADRLFVSAELDGIPVAVHISQKEDGISFDRAAWDFIGQRLTESGPTIFENVRVEAGDFLGGIPEVEEEIPPRSTLLIPLIQAAFSTIYVGAARGALKEAAEYVRTTTRPWLHSGVDRAAEDPSIVERFGSLEAHLRAAEALVDRGNEQVQAGLDRGVDLTERERGEIAVTVYSAKVVATEVTLETTSRVFDLQGARSAHRDYGFDRRWRDVRTHTLHDPVFYKQREVGDFALNDRVPEPDGNQYR